MRFEVDPDYSGEIDTHTDAIAQAAIDATATAYCDDAAIDVDERLRSELRNRGIVPPEEESIVQLARSIRSGHHVSVL
jgi:hypothetical protein